jgi:hypothetical protein
MKKGVWVLICCCLLSGGLHAQASYTWKEFFKQKKTELEYLGRHIASLQIYLKMVKDGYQLVQQGNNLIHQARNGELNLHDIFYLSLKLVNQRVRNYPAVSKTLDYHAFIARKSTALKNRSQASEYLKPAYKTAVNHTLDKLRSDMSDSLDELVQVLSDGELELTDDQRIKRIQALEQYAYKRMIFLQQYSQEVSTMMMDRMGETSELTTLGQLHHHP